MNYKAYRLKQKLTYTKYSIEKESKIGKFKKNLQVINTKNNTMIEMEHNPLQVAKDSYLWFVYNQMLLQSKMEESGEYVAVFITLTLPSQFHPYMTLKSRPNKRYDSNYTINEGYTLLNSAFRNIYKNFKINNKFEKTYYCRVVEPHKSGVPHLHAILYVKKEHLDAFKSHFKRVKKAHGLGRYDFQVINNLSRSIAYLLKYVQKNTNPANEKNFHFFNGWKKLNRIRVFTFSNLDLERYIFRKVNNVLKFSKGLTNKNPIVEVLENCDITINTNCLIEQEFKNDSKKHSITQPEGKEIKKFYTNPNARYRVEISRTRTIKEIQDTSKVFQEVDFDYEMINDRLDYKLYVSGKIDYFSHYNMSDFAEERVYEIKNIEKMNFLKYEKNAKCWIENAKTLSFHRLVEIEELKKEYRYKVDSFKIIDNNTEEVLYSKSDFMLLDDFKEQQYQKGNFNFDIHYI